MLMYTSDSNREQFLIDKIEQKLKLNIMKAKSIFKIVIFMVVLGITVSSCVQDDDYSIPNVDELNNPAAGLVANITIPQLKQMLTDHINNPGNTTNYMQIVSDVVVKGFVVSSDRNGNFFKELYIQDASSNATSAIRIELEINDLYTTFNPGREIFIRLKDLYIGLGDGDVVTIGDLDDDEVGRISENRALTDTSLYPRAIARSNNVETIVPNVMNFSDIGEAHIGMMVQVNGAQFASNLNGLPFVSPLDDFDTQRIMEACECPGSATNFILETSTFAAFKNVIMPTGAGSITAVVSREFDANNIVLVVNDYTDVAFSDNVADRCASDGIDTTGYTNSFTEDFEGMSTGLSVSGNGWTNFIEAGSRDWEVDFSTDSGNPSSRIASLGAFGSGEASNIAWLISPAINLDSQGVEVVTYETSNSFADNSNLEVYISTDWDGNPANILTATWDNVTGCANIVNDGQWFQDWIPGSISLESYSGTGYVAFRYVGGDADSNFNGTYEIDNFNVFLE